MQNFETNKKTVTYTLEEIKQNNIERIEEELKQEIPDEKNILDKHISVKDYGSYVEIEIIYEVKETIGTKEKIVF